MTDDQKYGPDWVPTPGEAAYADQQLAALRKRVDALVAYASGIEFPNRPLPILLGVEACNEILSQADGNDDHEFPIAVGMLGVAVAELAALRQQLDEARGELAQYQGPPTWQQLTETLLAWRNHVQAELDEARGRLSATLEHREKLRQEMASAIHDARAERDRLLNVYRAAEALVAFLGTITQSLPLGMLPHVVKLDRALNAYRAGATWTEAKPGDTPGQRDHEDDPPQPIRAGAPAEAPDGERA